MTTGELPEGRYGPARGTRSRWARPLWVALALLTGAGAAVLGYHNLGPSPIETTTVGFTLLPDRLLPDRPTVTAGQHTPPTVDAPPLSAHAVSLRFQVRRDDPASPAVCIVRARSLDGEETGRREVYVPPGTGPVELTTTIQTSRPPVTADVYGCSMRVPSYLRPNAGS